jgi:hypothetical protein
MKIEDIEWHDQILTRVEIDRANPGENDSILLDFKILYDTVTLLLKDVYHAELHLNFGIVAEETIRYLNISYIGEDVVAVKEKWSKIGVNLNELCKVELSTNSTNSLLRIYCLSYSITK